MYDADVSRLFDLADLILAVGRQLRPPQDRSTEMCTPVESIVMRFIDRIPGTSARAAADATLLPSSNLSREWLTRPSAVCGGAAGARAPGARSEHLREGGKGHIDDDGRILHACSSSAHDDEGLIDGGSGDRERLGVR